MSFDETEEMYCYVIVMPACEVFIPPYEWVREGKRQPGILPDLGAYL